MFIKIEEKMMGDRNRMKILIAYDGSEGAESAIDDMKRAGLPSRAEAVSNLIFKAGAVAALGRLRLFVKILPAYGVVIAAGILMLLYRHFAF
jgi:hypothetical protein